LGTSSAAAYPDYDFISDPPFSLIPDKQRRALTSNLAAIRDREALAAALFDWEFLEDCGNTLFDVVKGIHRRFDEIRDEAKQERARKARAKKMQAGGSNKAPTATNKRPRKVATPREPLKRHDNAENNANPLVQSIAQVYSHDNPPSTPSRASHKNLPATPSRSSRTPRQCFATPRRARPSSPTTPQSLYQQRGSVMSPRRYHPYNPPSPASQPRS
ncbi:hypothetical protein OF83DRAFT_1179308, partial [Amylostereum chailletii]